MRAARPTGRRRGGRGLGPARAGKAGAAPPGGSRPKKGTGAEQYSRPGKNKLTVLGLLGKGLIRQGDIVKICADAGELFHYILVPTLDMQGIFNLGSALGHQSSDNDRRPTAQIARFDRRAPQALHSFDDSDFAIHGDTAPMRTSCSV